MTAKPPPIPKDQVRTGENRHIAADDDKAAAPAGNAEINFHEQGRYGNLDQNVNAVQHKVQDR